MSKNYVFENFNFQSFFFGKVFSDFFFRNFLWFFNLFSDILNLKNNFHNLFLILIFLITWTATSAPRGKSCTVNNCHVAKTMPSQPWSGARDLFQTKNILLGCNSIFFFHRDENQNGSKLQGRLSYLSLFFIGITSHMFTWWNVTPTFLFFIIIASLS